MYCNWCGERIYARTARDEFPDDMPGEEARNLTADATLAEVAEAFAAYRVHREKHDTPSGGRLQLHQETSFPDVPPASSDAWQGQPGMSQS